QGAQVGQEPGRLGGEAAGVDHQHLVVAHDRAHVQVEAAVAPAVDPVADLLPAAAVAAHTCPATSRPSLTTAAIRSPRVASSNGSPSTTTTSARLPGSRVPSSSDRPSSSAA